MQSRSSKYEVESGKKTRTSRNEKLYQDVNNIALEYEYIDTNNAVDLGKLSKSRTSREDYQKQRELDKLIPREKQSKNIEVDDLSLKEDRVYDINEILKMAKENTLLEDEKKRLNTEYNILTKLDVDSLESDEMKKEERRSLVDDIYGKEKKKKKTKKKQEEDVDLLSNLMPSEDNPEDTISNEIKLDEVMKEKILDTMTQDLPKEDTDQIVTQIESITLTNTNLEETKEILGEDKKSKKKKEKKKKRKDDDFVFTTKELPVGLEKEDTKEIKKDLSDTEEYEYESDGKGLMIAIIIITILILITIGFFVYEYFFA